MEASVRSVGSQLRKLKMVTQKLRAEKDFYKSLYRQVKQQNDSRPFTANLPPKPTFRRPEPSQLTTDISKADSRHQTTSELQCDFVNMFDALVERAGSPSSSSDFHEESKLSVYIQQSELQSDDEATVEDAFTKAMQRAETSLTNFYGQLQDQYNPCNTTRD